MLNGHIDVVPPGDPRAWSDDPFSGAIRDGHLLRSWLVRHEGGSRRGPWAVQAPAPRGVRLRGDLLLASVQGEEDGGLGTFALLAGAGGPTHV